MSAYLAYLYSTGLTKKEQTEIDEKTKKSREEFSKGFVKGAIFLLAAYSLYSLTDGASAICAAALQSGDFDLSLVCAYMLVVEDIVYSD